MLALPHTLWLSPANQPTLVLTESVLLLHDAHGRGVLAAGVARVQRGVGAVEEARLRALTPHPGDEAVPVVTPERVAAARVPRRVPDLPADHL